MEFLKKHYEKILLGLVLAGLVGSLVFMPFYISADNQEMVDLTTSIIANPSVKALPDLDLTAETTATSRLAAPYILDLQTTNKLFNPMDWQKNLEGNLIPVAGHIGPSVVVVTKIEPLYLIVSLDSADTNGVEPRYSIGVEKQAEKIPAKRRKVEHFVSVGDKANDVFSDFQVKGAPENPDSVTLKLLDSGEFVTISQNKPYRRVDGYAVDFRYDPEKLVARGKRVGDHVTLNGTDFVVDDVKENELVLRDQSNQKKTTLNFVP